MKKFLTITLLGIILLNSPSNARQTKWVMGKLYENEITWTKNTKFLLPPGEKFKLISKAKWTSWGIEINGKWFVSQKENLYHQSLTLNRIGSTKYLAYLAVIYDEIFFKNRYDGCYPRPEYTVMKLRRKGGFFNCFLVYHVDIQKELYAPDDPEDSTAHAQYAIKKYGVELPEIALCAETIFYAPSITQTVMGISYCINPETNGASKNKYTSEEKSEYHPQNINDYPDKKKFMEEFIKIAAKRHKYFEKEIKAKEKHKLDLTEFGVGETIEETKTTNTSSTGDITVEIKELHELYKEGVLTKEEFEKAKKKILDR